MSIRFTREEVRGHLRDLGFANVSENRLDQFLKDLRRLIKYEEQKKEKNLTTTSEFVSIAWFRVGIHETSYEH
jgi:Asp-tRNA(Asn)/Glu-tRNA(Gln) amidotransferase C subunit